MNTKYCINDYLELLHNKKTCLENTPQGSCEKCNGTGEVEIFIPLLNKEVIGTCDCVVNEDLENIKEKTIKAKNMLEKYYNAFGFLDDELNFEKYKSIYKENTKVIDLLDKYLTHSMDNAILLTGESGTGKTTMLKMIWQILMLNKKNVYYKIFDNARAFKQKVIIASNKNFDEIIKSYESKDDFMASRLQTRLENLNLVECYCLGLSCTK